MSQEQAHTVQSKAVWRFPTYCCVSPPEALKAALPWKRLSIRCFAMPCWCTSSLWAGLRIWNHAVYHYMAAGRQICPWWCWWKVNSAVQHKDDHHKESEKENKKILCRQKELYLKSWTHITMQAGSEHWIMVVPQSEGGIQGKLLVAGYSSGAQTWCFTYM